jgi:hypothetical protein
VLAHFALFAGSIFLCAKAFGKPVAAILCLGWGTSVLFIGNVNSIAPEWLQGHVVVLTILLHAVCEWQLKIPQFVAVEKSPEFAV